MRVEREREGNKVRRLRAKVQGNDEVIRDNEYGR